MPRHSALILRSCSAKNSARLPQSCSSSTYFSWNLSAMRLASDLLYLSSVALDQPLENEDHAPMVPSPLQAPLQLAGGSVLGGALSPRPVVRLDVLRGYGAPLDEIPHQRVVLHHAAAPSSPSPNATSSACSM